LPNKFEHIEIQTSGTTLEDWYLRFLREHVRVNTISLSLSDMFDSNKNALYNQTKKGYEIDIKHLCSEIKRYDFNLRLSLNMTDVYNNRTPEEIFDYAKNILKADQITFRVLYESKKNTIQDKWIKEHRLNENKMNKLYEFVKLNGHALERLSFGAMRYSVDEISVVVDDDCMNIQAKEEMKYVILRPNCRLYSKWDDKGSLIY
jgi:sulfatase maturation enzyme AslB (radical SAM superfamily)